MKRLSKKKQQKRGTAIGTKFAPPYAILYMADLKENCWKFLKKSQ